MHWRSFRDSWRFTVGDELVSGISWKLLTILISGFLVARDLFLDITLKINLFSSDFSLQFANFRRWKSTVRVDTGIVGQWEKMVLVISQLSFLNRRVDSLELKLLKTRNATRYETPLLVGGSIWVSEVEVVRHAMKFVFLPRPRRAWAVSDRAMLLLCFAVSFLLLVYLIEDVVVSGFRKNHHWWLWNVFRARPIF